MEDKKPPTFWETVMSVLAAMFGVQKQRNRERDFTYGSPWRFIAVGVVLTIIFVLSLVVVVRLVIPYH